MYYFIDLDPKHRALRVTVTESTFNEDQLTELYRSIAHFASRGGPYTGILDLSRVARMPISASAIRSLAASPPAIPAGTLRVIVAKEPIVYGLSRMFELNRGGMLGQLQVVWSIDEAYSLLGVSSGDFSQRLFPATPAV